MPGAASMTAPGGGGSDIGKTRGGLSVLVSILWVSPVAYVPASGLLARIAALHLAQAGGGGMPVPGLNAQARDGHGRWRQPPARTHHVGRTGCGSGPPAPNPALSVALHRRLRSR